MNEWTPCRVATHIREAAETLRRLPERQALGLRSAWPEIARDFWEAYGWTDARVPLGPPSAAAIDRMEETLTWFRWLAPDDTRLLWLRAEGVRWKAICRRFRISRTTAWRRWAAALARIAEALNEPRRMDAQTDIGCKNVGDNRNRV